MLRSVRPRSGLTISTIASLFPAGWRNASTTGASQGHHQPSPNPHKLVHPVELARYISTVMSTRFNAGATSFMRRMFHQPLQPHALRSQSTRPIRLSQPPLTNQLRVSDQAPLHPPSHAETKSILIYFHPAPPPLNSTQPPTDTPLSTSTAAACARRQHPITFTQFYRQMAFDGLIQDIKPEPQPHPTQTSCTPSSTGWTGCVQSCTPPSTI